MLFAQTNCSACVVTLRKVILFGALLLVGMPISQAVLAFIKLLLTHKQSFATVTYMSFRLEETIFQEQEEHTFLFALERK